MRETWTDILVTSWHDVLRQAAVIAPRLFALLILMLVGLMIATLARRLTARVLQALDFDRRCATWGLKSVLQRSGLRQPPGALAARMVFWTICLVVLLMAVEALEMPAASGIVGVALQFLPNLFIAALVAVAGWILANFLGQAALIGAVNAQIAGAPLLAAAVRWTVLVFAGAAALTQLGIARQMVLLAFGIAFGGTVLALALAFGLGGKDLAREILESRLRKQGKDGDDLTHV